MSEKQITMITFESIQKVFGLGEVSVVEVDHMRGIVRVFNEADMGEPMKAEGSAHWTSGTIIADDVRPALITATAPAYEVQMLEITGDFPVKGVWLNKGHVVAYLRRRVEDWRVSGQDPTSLIRTELDSIADYMEKR